MCRTKDAYNLIIGSYTKLKLISSYLIQNIEDKIILFHCFNERHWVTKVSLFVEDNQFLFSVTYSLHETFHYQIRQFWAHKLVQRMWWINGSYYFFECQVTTSTMSMKKFPPLRCLIVWPKNFLVDPAKKHQVERTGN